MDDIHDPTDFRDSSLQQIDRVLRCDICKDLYNTPVQLQTCIHSFCALCIRRRLAQERVCPSCKTPADEKKLIRNGVLEECVNTWRSRARQLVITLESGTSLQPNSQQQSQLQSQAQSPVESIPTLPRSRRSARLGNQLVPRYEDQDFQQPELMKPVGSSPPIQPSPSPAASAASASSAAPTNPALTQESVVECPLCRQSMKQVVINEHIDRCMNGDSSIPEPPRQFFRPAASSPSSTSSATVISLVDDEDVKQKKKVDLGKRPINLVYDMLNTKDLKKTLRDLGLSDLGDRQQMVWRHKEYKTLYEANMDAEHPRDVKELKQQLNEAENAYNIARNNTQTPQVNMEEHNNRYKDQFAELIALARKRQKRSDKASKEDNK